MKLFAIHNMFFYFVLALRMFQPCVAQRDFSLSCDIIDIALLIDSSEGVNQESFESIRRFAINLISELNVGMQNTRIAAVQTWSESQTLWTFSDSSEAHELIHVIEGLEYTGGNQLIHQSFAHLATEIFQAEYGDRVNVRDAVVILTGGKVTDEAMDSIALLKQRDIHVLLVAYGEEIDNNWRSVASEPAEDNFFYEYSAFHMVFQLQSPTLANCPETIQETTETYTQGQTTQPSVVSTTTTNRENLCSSGSWTAWYNSDNPQGLGDDESLWSLRLRFPGAICEFPNDFEARVAETKIPFNISSPNIIASAVNGFECLNFIGGPCLDYEIRFCCNEDPYIVNPPSSSSPITDASVTTATTRTATPPEESTQPPSTTDSENLSTLEPTCPDGGWTPWYNGDNPGDLGDDESLTNLRNRYPGAICDSPLTFQARDANTLIPLNSSSTNVFASRLTGLECLNFIGEPCIDYEIRFCCPKGPRCFVGSKTTEGEISRNEQAQVQCSVGELCSDVTSTVVTYNAGELVSTTTSIGLCMSRQQCSRLSCESIHGLLTSQPSSSIQNCRAKCCHGDLCNRPTVPPTQTTTTTTDRTSTFSRRREPGTRCFTGIDITGSPQLSRYGRNILGYKVTQCDAGFVCSNLKATPIFRRGLFAGAVVHQSQCLPRVACGTTDCDYVKSLLPDTLHVDLVNCSVRCCDWDNCNQPEGNIKIVTEAPQVTSTQENTQTKGQMAMGGKHKNILVKTISPTNPPSLTTSTPTMNLIVKTIARTTPSYDVDFLPSCTVSQAVASVFWCESLLSTTHDNNGGNGCRNKIKEIARCVQKQFSWCLRGGGANLLDDLQLPNLNSRTILQLLVDIQSNDSTLSQSVNNFCSFAGTRFPIPISTVLDGCELNYLNELRRRAKTFFTVYSSSETRDEICRASQSFQQWFVVATYRKCLMQGLDLLGYQNSTAQQLKRFINAALRTLKNLEPVSCSVISNSSI